jgi:predicted O-methyltransferase YrrM
MHRVDLSWIEGRLRPWSLSVEVLRLLGSLVRHLQPALVVEFGSGVSTACLHRACQDSNRSCRIVSIDHDPDYLDSVRDEFDGVGSPLITLHLAPIVARAPCQEFLPTYRFTPELVDVCRPADLVLIDGPPDALGGREGVLYQVMDFAKPGSLVLLDDADRESERQALAGWQDNFGEAIRIQILDGFPKGLAAITIVQPVPTGQLWNHRVRLSARELARFGRPEDAMVLLDENQWGLTKEDVGHSLASLVEVPGTEQGPPPDDAAAIHRLKRARRAGARLVAFGWPAFWWLTAYPGLHAMLETCGKQVLCNRRLIAYDISDLPS